MEVGSSLVSNDHAHNMQAWTDRWRVFTIPHLCSAVGGKIRAPPLTTQICFLSYFPTNSKFELYLLKWNQCSTTHTAVQAKRFELESIWVIKSRTAFSCCLSKEGKREYSWKLTVLWHWLINYTNGSITGISIVLSEPSVEFPTACFLLCWFFRCIFTAGFSTSGQKKCNQPVHVFAIFSTIHSSPLIHA